MIFNSIPHSSYYHRRFQDYVEVSKIDENGRQYIERTYVGQYYSLDADSNKKWQLKVLYPILYIISFILFVTGETIVNASSLNKPAQLVVFLCLAVMLYYGITVIRYVIRPDEMTVWEYHSGPVQIKRFSKYIIFLQLLNAACTIPFLFLVEKDMWLGELQTIVCCIIAAIPMFFLYSIEAKQHYSVHSSDAEMDKNGYYME